MRRKYFKILDSNRAADRRSDTETTRLQDFIIRSDEGINQNGFTNREQIMNEITSVFNVWAFKTSRLDWRREE